MTKVLRSKSTEQSLSLTSLKIEVPSTVPQHFLFRIKPKNPHKWFIAVNNATVWTAQDYASDVLIEQNTVKVSPHGRFVLNHRGASQDWARWRDPKPTA